MNEKITVLVADDNSDFTMTLSSYLEKEEQIQIVGIAKDGNEAYEKAIELKPDILLLDIIMPHLDGLGVLEKLGETNLEKSPLVIILSAVGQDKITQKAISLGAQYYIVKPFDINVLIKRMKELKNYQPTQFKGGFITREIKAQYIDIAPDKPRKPRSTSNKYHSRSWSTSSHKRIPILKRSNNDGNKRYRCNQSNYKTTLS